MKQTGYSKRIKKIFLLGTSGERGPGGFPVEAKKITLEDPIQKFLPDYPLQGHHVTVRHLLNHTSGIRGYRIMHEENRQRFRLDVSYQEIIDLFAKQSFNFKPGEKQEYNNFGYYLLGKIIKRVTGSSCEEYVELELIQPLG